MLQQALPLALLATSVIGSSKGCPASCSSNGPLSCQNTTVQSNTCCFNAPGGQLLQTQFWDTDPPSGPAEHWTLHGLWPDNCDGTYQQYCDESRQYKNITEILESFGQTALLNYMTSYWTDENGEDETFWEHEFGKHATCISTLNPSCYTDYIPTEEVVDFFTTAVNLFETLDTYSFLSDAGIVPSSSTNYSYSDIMSALNQARGVDATIQCEDGVLSELWYTFNVQGSIQTGEFVAVEPVGESTSCPTSGAQISYPPKNVNQESPVSTVKSVRQTATLATSCHPTFMPTSSY